MSYGYGGSSAVASGSSLGSAAQSPITRSRTGLFLSYRDTVIRSTNGRASYSDNGKGKGRAYDFQDENTEEHEGLLAVDRGGRQNGGHEVIQMNQLPPQWSVVAMLFCTGVHADFCLPCCFHRIDEADRVDDILERLKPKCELCHSCIDTKADRCIIVVTQLDKLHAKHVLPGFSDKTAEEREIASLTSDITRELRKCQHIIMKIAQHAKNLPLSTTTKEDCVMIQNVQTALATKVQDASAVFRKKQSNYLKRKSGPALSLTHSLSYFFCTELRGYELRNQDILAASGAIAVKDSYASMNDDMELVSAVKRLHGSYRSFWLT